jgi:alpha-L-glutamate ligase-like protein
MNRRNAEFLLPLNPRRHYPRVDDKLLTKRFCELHGIPAPNSYAVIARQGDVRKFHTFFGERGQFVVKPTRGSEGRGILVIAESHHDGWITANGRHVSTSDMRYHLSAILAGLFSLAGRPDCAVIEERIQPHPAMQHACHGGTPDIRVIVYRGIPAMAMVRLPTAASGGRANLHQGAVAAGIELHTGRTRGGVRGARLLDAHPDTGASLAGWTIPHWESLLAAAIRLAGCLELGYLGIDFVLDEHRGPVVLEANARPGLAIQLANRCGLLHRLQAIDAQLAADEPSASRLPSPERELGLVARIANAPMSV